MYNDKEIQSTPEGTKKMTRSSPKIIGQNPGDQLHLSDKIRRQLGSSYGRIWNGMGWDYPNLEQIFPQLEHFDYTIDFELGKITLGERK